MLHFLARYNLFLPSLFRDLTH